MSTQQVLGVLQTAREELESVLASPLSIEKYREDISKECNVATESIKELKEAEARKEGVVQRLCMGKIGQQRWFLLAEVRQYRCCSNKDRSNQKGAYPHSSIGVDYAHNRKRLKQCIVVNTSSVLLVVSLNLAL